MTFGTFLLFEVVVILLVIHAIVVQAMLLNGLSVPTQQQHQQENHLIYLMILKPNMMHCKYLFILFISILVSFGFFSKSYKYKKRDRVLAKVIEKQATVTKTPDVPRIIQE